ncbi:hypothetical protein EDC04DRAFT_996420 [Pisolithus marmoratus]|nr:hypothetical protein EDC04DRAFT_996420 [Pisolithus marmoratus]
MITVIQYSDVDGAKRRDSGGALNDGSHLPEPSMLTPFYTVASPQAWRREPACTQRREQFTSIRECFYALVNMRQPGARDKSANRWKADEAIKFFSEMFGLKYLRNFVGETTFFKDLKSLTVTESRSEVSVGGAGGQPVTSKLSFVSWVMTHNLLKRQLPSEIPQEPRLKVLLPLLRRRCQGLDPFEDMSHQHAEEQKTEHEVKSLSQTLGAGLLEYISTIFNNAALPDKHTSIVHVLNHMRET